MDGYYGLDKILTFAAERLAAIGHAEDKAKLELCICKVLSHPRAKQIPFNICLEAFKHAQYAKSIAVKEAFVMMNNNVVYPAKSDLVFVLELD